MGARQRKKEIIALLEEASLSREELISRMKAFTPAEAIPALFSALCDSRPHVRWWAVVCMGMSVARLALGDLEAARVVMRRFLWSLNDESGGIGWGAPEAMAESMCQQEVLAREYVHMLVSYMRQDGEELCQDGNYLEHPLLQRGLLWGIARMSGCRPDLMIEHRVVAELMPYFGSNDAEVRALTALCAGLLHFTEARPALEELCLDKEEVILFLHNKLTACRVGELASTALERLAPL